MESLNIIKSKRGKDMLVYNDFIYNIERNTRKGTSWRCRNRDCTGRAYTNLERTTVISILEHDHDANLKELNQIKLNTMLKTLSKESNEDFRNAFSSIVHNLGCQNMFKKKMENMRDDYTKDQNKNLQRKNEKTIMDEIPMHFRSTLENEKFLFLDTGFEDKDRLIIFTTDNFIRKLENSTCWLGDATFKSTPKEFYQFFIVHGVIFNKSFPLIFVLMSSKTMHSYLRIFDFINSKVSKKPKLYISDFESAQINSFKKTFPKADYKGCNFHFSQIIWRWIGEFNFVSLYKKCENFKMFIKKMISLSFIPETDVEKLFFILKKKYNNSNSCYDKIINRMYLNFIEKNSSSHNLSFWNCSDRVLCSLPITTNACEGYHRSINNYFKTKHPNMARFLDFLQKEQQRISFLIEEARNGIVKLTKNKKLEKIRNIIRAIHSYDSEDLLSVLSLLVEIKITK